MAALRIQFFDIFCFRPIIKIAHILVTKSMSASLLRTAPRVAAPLRVTPYFVRKPLGSYPVPTEAKIWWKNRYQVCHTLFIFRNYIPSVLVDKFLIVSRPISRKLCGNSSGVSPRDGYIDFRLDG